MFSIRQKREIADAVQKILRETNHPELPIGEIQFLLHVDGAEGWSWAVIKNNGAVPEPACNPWNEGQDPVKRHAARPAREWTVSAEIAKRGTAPASQLTRCWPQLTQLEALTLVEDIKRGRTELQKAETYSAVTIENAAGYVSTYLLRETGVPYGEETADRV